MDEPDPHDVLLSTPHARALLRTDRRGALVRGEGMPPRDAEHLAERIDLALAAVTALGRAAGLGGVTTVVLELDDGLLVAGRAADARHVAVLAGREANVGLLLSRLRRVLADAGSSATAAPEALHVGS